MYIIHVHGLANVLGHHCDYGDVMYFDVFLAGNIAVLSKDLSGQKLNWESRRDVTKLADFASFWLQRSSNLAKIRIDTCISKSQWPKPCLEMYSTVQESKITSGLMDHLTCLQTCNLLPLPYLNELLIDSDL